MNSVAIQQTLHGYAEGHRRLDGSIKLGDEAARLVLRMSDLSGSSVISGFEEYLTGYPLQSAKMYALAKTWYASEMPRPGCVWTHTLFIPVSCMSEIPNLESLIARFVRPRGPNRFKGYSKPMEFEVPERFSEQAVTSNDGLTIQIGELIETLYVQGKNNVLIGTQSSRTFESALMRVWSQQWPRLRSAFSFCTGALSSRGFGGKPFDVQCTHPSLVREISSNTLAKLSQELSSLVKSDQKLPSWFTRAVADACKPNGWTFRRLLWEFADEPNWNSFGSYARLIAELLDSSERDPDSLLGIVARFFPSASEGAGLKAALFGGKQDIPGFRHFDEVEVLSAVALTSHFEAYSSEALQLKARGSDLCRRDPRFARETISRLFRSSINPLGEDILAGIAEAINPSIAQAVTVEQPQFLSALFRAKPELGSSVELWTAAGDRRRELLDSITLNKNLSAELIEAIVCAFLKSNAEFLLQRALETWGRPAVIGVFDWLAKDNGTLSERSLDALAAHVEEIVKWLIANKNCPQRVTIVAAHIIAPYSNRVRHLDSSIWLSTFRNLAMHGNPGEANYFAALLLALGFQNAPPDALSLVEECFERVHQVAWDDALPDDAWVILDPFVPHLMWLHDWDKCERLRRGLIEAFVKYRWLPLKLENFVKNDLFRSRVIDSAKKVDGGRELILQTF